MAGATILNQQEPDPAAATETLSPEEEYARKFYRTSAPVAPVTPEMTLERALYDNDPVLTIRTAVDTNARILTDAGFTATEVDAQLREEATLVRDLDLPHADRVRFVERVTAAKIAPPRTEAEFDTLIRAGNETIRRSLREQHGQAEAERLLALGNALVKSEPRLQKLFEAYPLGSDPVIVSMVIEAAKQRDGLERIGRRVPATK